MGYGYDYACEMFNNIGMIPHIEILGTKAANDVENEVAEDTIRDIYTELDEEFSDGRKSSEQSGGEDDSNVLPFRK